MDGWMDMDLNYGLSVLTRVEMDLRAEQSERRSTSFCGEGRMERHCCDGARRAGDCSSVVLVVFVVFVPRSKEEGICGNL
jgi:hypothetical protein